MRLVRPDVLLEQNNSRLIQAALPLEGLIKSFTLQAENRFQTASRLLESFSYERILERGFVLALTPQGIPVTSAGQAMEQQELLLKFTDNVLPVSTALSRQKPQKKKPQNPDDDKQGRLL